MSKAHGIFCSAYLWANLIYFALDVINVELFQENILILLLLGVVFFIKLFLNARNYYQKDIMLMDIDEIDNDVLLDLKIRTYNYLHKNLHIRKSELLLASLLKIHNDNCQESTCPCKMRS